MNNYINLTRLFIKSLKINKANKKSGRILFNILLWICILFIFIPFILLFSVFVIHMINELNDVGYAKIGFEVLLMIISIFTFIFSFNILLNELYFSEDIENLISLPLKPTEIVAAKFTSCFIIENFLLFILLFCSCISYKIAVGVPLINIIILIPEIIFLPMIPMIYCGIILLFIMNLLKKVTTKKVLHRIGFFFIMILVTGIFILLLKLTNFNFEKYVTNFAKGNHEFLVYMRVLFPHIKLFANSLDSINVQSMVLYYGINLIYIAIALCLSKKLYYSGVIEFFNKDTEKKLSSIRLQRNNIVKTTEQAYSEKEIKTLFRSPTFFINCILINGIWPIFVYLLAKISLSSHSLSEIKKLVHTNNDYMILIILLYIVGISIIVPAINSIASSSFSREGKNYYFIKYIPMKYHKQWQIKLNISLIISFIGINVFTTIFYGIIKMNPLLMILLYIVSFLCILNISWIGILIDSLFPKIIWDEEADALRENYNSFIVMGFALFIFGVLCVGGYYLWKKTSFTYIGILTTILLILIISNGVLSLLATKLISDSIKNQENV